MAETKKKTGFRGPESARIATQWKPGQSGNPGGRPKMRAYSEACREIGKLPMSEIEQIVKDPESSGIEVVTAQQIIKAAKGFSASAVWVSDRAEGKPTQPIAMVDPITEATAKEIVELAKMMDDSGHMVKPFPGSEAPKLLPEAPAYEANVLTVAQVALDTREIVQKHQDEERARQLMHQGKPFPAF